MNPVTRRTFVGGVVAGLPLIAHTGAGGQAQSAGQSHSHTPAAGNDPVMQHLVRQMVAIHNGARARNPRGEDARAMAAQLRTMAVYARQADLDAQFTAELRGAIEREGREAVLYSERDPNTMRAEMKRWGIVVDERFFRYPINPDYRERNAALDRLLEEGITSTLDRMAGALERVGPRLDRQTAGVARVALAQDDAWWDGYCSSIWDTFKLIQLDATVICPLAAAPWFGFLFVYPCLALQLAALLFFLIWVFYC